MILWTSFLLGLVGSLHCAAMCGPLVLALPVNGKSRADFVVSRLVYNAGRLTSYLLLGVLFGLIGTTLALAGLQRWTSIAAGFAILAGLLMSSRFAIGRPLVRCVALIKSAFAGLLRRRSLSSMFLLGGANGLLPCGLVYVACAAATTAGSFGAAVGSMLLFGLGTLPMMLGLGLIQVWALRVPRLNLQRLIPLSLLLVGLLLVLRGMSLGIPYLSPNLAGQSSSALRCH